MKGRVSLMNDTVDLLASFSKYSTLVITFCSKYSTLIITFAFWFEWCTNRLKIKRLKKCMLDFTDALYKSREAIIKENLKYEEEIFLLKHTVHDYKVKLEKVTKWQHPVKYVLSDDPNEIERSTDKMPSWDKVVKSEDNV